MLYAIVKTGGKQNKVEEGGILSVEKLDDAKAGDEITLNEVLFLSNEGAVTIGRPLIEGASVSAKVLAQKRAPKVLVFKRRPKKGYKKLQGHRQYITQLKVTKINFN
ncbi:MAG: 50S ribosomal protein L21 [Elusimicrobiota bacterium]|jgi:large subunit ribosomal protein L21|nr:50S ribosomal protein L21 [Elusimicrobiota bacterium]